MAKQSTAPRVADGFLPLAQIAANLTPYWLRVAASPEPKKSNPAPDATAAA